MSQTVKNLDFSVYMKSLCYLVKSWTDKMYDILVELVIQVSLEHSSFTSFVPCNLNILMEDFFRILHEFNIKGMSRCVKVDWPGQVDQLIWQIINLHSGARFANTQQRTAHCTNMHHDTYY